MALATMTEVDKTDVLNFWGEVGRGKSTDAFPPWYFENAMEKLAEEIENAERRVNSVAITEEQRERLRTEIKVKSKRLDENKNTMINLKKGYKETLDKMQKELADVLTPTMYTRKDREKGIVNEYADMMTDITWSIKVTNLVARNMVAYGFNVEDRDGAGYVRRDDANIFWKVIRRALGEYSDIEALRK